MSDQGPYDPYAGDAPAPQAPQPSADVPPYEPPPGYAPPPAYAPQPAYAPPGPGLAGGAPAPKKRSVGVIVLVVLAVIACATVACIGTVAFNVLSAQGRTRDAVQQAEAHLDTATGTLEAATDDLDRYLESGEAEDQAAVSEQMRATRDEIAAARAAVEPLPESAGRTAYLGALDEANKAVEGLEQMLGTVAVIVDLSDQVKRGGEDVEDGNEALNAAIGAGNRRDFTTMKAKARVASRAYASGAKVFAEAHKAEPSAGLDAVVEYANLRKKQADLVVKMADEGRAGRTSAYNKLVDQQAALGEKAEQAGTPEIVSDPEWGSKRISEQQTAFEQAAQRADELRAEALKAFGLAE